MTAYRNPFDTPTCRRANQGAVNALNELVGSFRALAGDLEKIADQFDPSQSDSYDPSQPEAFIAMVMGRLKHVPDAANVMNDSAKWVAVKGERAAVIDRAPAGLNG